jgi:hypothetical protein
MLAELLERIVLLMTLQLNLHATRHCSRPQNPHAHHADAIDT